MNKATKWCLAITAGLCSLLITEDAWAWGPATHFHYGLTVLDRLNQFSVELRSLLTSQTLAFLYGCLSADIVLAKKLGRAMTHCHNWDMGIRLIDEAPTPRIKAFAYGYVSHLAADTISHNCYVPSKTIESFDSGVLKHLYWELVFDKKVTTRQTLHLFHEIAKGDFGDCDAHLEKLIPTRILDFSFNKKVFNQLLMLQGLHQWQKLLSGISNKSPWPLTDREVQHFSERAVSAVMSFLHEHRNSKYLLADPTGSERLRSAHSLRRYFKKQIGQDQPLSLKDVRHASQEFAREPFRLILTDDLRAA